MKESFVITNSNEVSEVKQQIVKFYPESGSDSLEVGTLKVIWRTRKNDTDLCENDIKKVIIIGHIVNLAQITHTYFSENSNIPSMSPEQIVARLLKEFGRRAIKMLEGKFLIIHCVDQDSIEIYMDVMGTIPVYYSHDQRGKVWITSEVKSLFGIESIDFTVKKLTSLYHGKIPLDPFASPYQHIMKLPAGWNLKLTKTEGNKFRFTSSQFHQIYSPDTPPLSEMIAEERLEQLLTEAVMFNMKKGEILGVPLSGGLDSSIISALVKEQVCDLHTFCIGTEFSNEFAFAKKVASYINSMHHELLFTEADFKHSLIQTLFYNEVFDSLCIEIQLPFFLLYHYIKQFATNVVTGYGADMLFAGHVKPDAVLSNVNDSLYRSMLRIQWRGEYAPFVEFKAGVSVYHPFCNSKLINFALNLNAEHKIKNRTVKYILRQFAVRKGHLPLEICYREKIAIEVASAINKHFSRYLNLVGNAYETKNIFTHTIFTNLFQHHMPVSEIDIDECRANFVRHAIAGVT